MHARFSGAANVYVSRSNTERVNILPACETGGISEKVLEEREDSRSPCHELQSARTQPPRRTEQEILFQGVPELNRLEAFYIYLSQAQAHISESIMYVYLVTDA
jgi:hypothetical protein